MQSYVDAFVNETHAMDNAYREQYLALEKRRQKLFENLSSLEFVTSNWEDEEDQNSISRVQKKISENIEKTDVDMKSIQSIKKELVDRQNEIKSCLAVLLDLYRSLSRPKETLPTEESILAQDISETLTGRGEFAYYPKFAE